MLSRSSVLRCAAPLSTRLAGHKLVAKFGIFSVLDAGDKVYRVQMSADPSVGAAAAEGAKKKSSGWKLNLMDNAFFSDLHACFSTITAMQDEVRCVVLHPALGAHFSAGLDLKSVAPILMDGVTTTSKAKLAVSAVTGLPTPTVTEPGLPAMRNMNLRVIIQRYQDSVSMVARARVPVIAAVSGLCLGGAVDLSSACDFRFASKDATLSIK